LAEVRVKNAKTGGEKGSKDERFDLLPYEQLAEVARHFGVGAAKYEPHNWKKGYDWSLSESALMRHFAAFMEGEEIDEETGSHHLAAVVFHALALLYFKDHHRELDDRKRGYNPKSKPKPMDRKASA